MRHILVAFDGSQGSIRAAGFAQRLAAETGAKLTLLLVLDPPTVFPLGPFDSFAVATHEPTPEHLDRARKLLESAAKDMPAERVSRVVEIGAPAETICAQADKLGAELIVVGARGLGPAGRWLLGSVSDRVVHHASVPVTVVR